MKKSEIQVGSEYLHTKSSLKVKILRVFAVDYFEARKPNGDKMIVSNEFLEPCPNMVESAQGTIVKRGRGRPKQSLSETNPYTKDKEALKRAVETSTAIEGIKIKRGRGRPKKILTNT